MILKVGMSHRVMGLTPSELSFCTQLLVLVYPELFDHGKPVAAGDRDPLSHS